MNKRQLSISWLVKSWGTTCCASGKMFESPPVEPPHVRNWEPCMVLLFCHPADGIAIIFRVVCGSTTRGQGTSDSMIDLELEGDSLSDSQSNFASPSQSDEGFPAPEDILQQHDAELTSRNFYTGWNSWWSRLNAAGSTGDASWSANTAAAAHQRHPWQRRLPLAEKRCHVLLPSGQK